MTTKDHPTTTIGRTRKRRRARTTNPREKQQVPSWSSLLWAFAAAAIVASPPSFSSSSSSATTSSWAVRGQPTPTATASNGQEPSQLRATETTNVRGGRGEGRGGRAFVRQPQQQPGMEEESTSADDGNSNSSNNNNNNNELQKPSMPHRDREQHDKFLAWCQDSLGIDVGLVEIDHFDYPDYLRAMEDRIDVFCEDCNEDEEEDEDEDTNDNDFQSDNTMDTTDAATREKIIHGRSIPEIKSLDDADRYLSAFDEYPPVSVRGLKASRDIGIGEVVLSIPHGALWTIHNAIDASGDYDLVEAMGPLARQTHGWECPGMDEIPLLAVTLLYHMDRNHHNINHSDDDDDDDDDVSRGEEHVPDHQPYLEILELQTNRLEDSIPHLWSSRKLRKSATPSVRNVAKGIRKDVVDLYESIVVVLIENHPEIFGKHNNKDLDGEDNDNDSTESEDEWMFSLEKFHWAFALVNSRHWHLQIPDDPMAPIPQTEEDPLAAATAAEPLPPPALSPNPELEDPDPAFADTNAPQVSEEEGHESFSDQEGPPAATPTDEWVVIQDQKLREEEEREMKLNDELENGGRQQNQQPPPFDTPAPPQHDTIDDVSEGSNNDEEEEYWPPGNSFLAPLADLLNFGPPCTRGIYNPDSMAFEIVATCEFRAGQEITFWYTDACEDVFVANYGFTVPMMVPKCYQPSSGESTNTQTVGSEVVWQQQQQEQQVQYLEDEVFHAYEELDRLDRRLEYLVNVLEDCNCGNTTELLAGAFDEEKEDFHGSNESDNENESSERESGNLGAEGSGAENDASDVSGAALDGTTSPGASGKPLPASPSPPIPQTSSNSNKKKKKNNGFQEGMGPDAQHAIRNRNGSRKTNKSNSNKSNSNKSNSQKTRGSSQESQQQQQQPRQHHHRRGHSQSMTRFRSRRQHPRYEFDI